MAWSDFKEVFSRIGDTLTLGAAIGVGVAVVAAAAMYPMIFVVGGAMLTAATVGAVAAEGVKRRKGNAPAARQDDRTTRDAAGYFYLEGDGQEPASRFQELVSQEQTCPGWER